MTGPDGTMTLPGGMVEAAARALHEHDRLEFPNDPLWDGLDDDRRDSYREAVTAVLSAALAIRGICGDKATTLIGPPTGRVCELLAGHVGWHQCSNDDGVAPMSWTAQP